MHALTDLNGTLMDFAAKATAILLVACVLATSLRRVSAAGKHIIWASALCACALLPLARVTLPVLPLRVLPPDVQTSAPSRPGSKIDASRADITRASVAVPSVVPTGHPALAEARTVAPRVATISTMPAIIWLVGVAMLLARFAAGKRAVRQLAAQARPAADSRILARLHTHTGVLHVRRRRVTLLISPRESMPVTWGVLRPTILLPPSALNWPDARLDAVLTHELAHVARFDALSHTIGQLAVSVLWFHPLAWLAYRKAHAERERACDDHVLVRGISASQYAGDLLQLMTSLASRNDTASAALAMGRRAGLDVRLAAILDPRANRRGLSRLGLSVAALFVATALPLSAAQLAKRPLVRAAQPRADEPNERVSVSATTRALQSTVASTESVVAPPPAFAAATPSGFVNMSLRETPLVQPTPELSVSKEIPVAPVDWSGRWIPLHASEQEARFDVGLSDIDGNGVIIAQDAKTLTITRAISSVTREVLTSIQGPIDTQATYSLDGTWSSPSRLGSTQASVGRWTGTQLVIQSTNPSGEWQTTYSMRGDQLSVASAGLNRVVSLFKRASSPPHPDFFGTWVSDTTKNASLVEKGVWAQFDQGARLILVPSPETLTVTYNYPGGRRYTAAYALDGSETTTKGFYYDTEVDRAHWNDDALIVISTASRQPPLVTAYSLDGGELRIETTEVSSRSKGTTVAYYRRVIFTGPSR